MKRFRSTIEHLIKNQLWKKNLFINWLMLPFSYIYWLCHLINYNILHRPQKLRRPVICVGNLVAGGAGKTPIALEIAKLYQKNGWSPAFVGHGYKSLARKILAVTKVDPKICSATDVGDEALLLSKIAPTYISNKRADAAKAAINEGADLIILDDGMQDNSIYKDYRIIVLDSEYMLGNGKLLPAGPLREMPSCALSKADNIIIIGQDSSKLLNAKNWLLQQYINVKREKIILGQLKIKNINQLIGAQYVLLLGVADPKKIMNSLQNLGVSYIKTFIFPDHHLYSDEELTEIYNSAKTLNCKVLTTSKDYERISAKYHDDTIVIKIEIMLENLPLIKRDSINTEEGRC